MKKRRELDALVIGKPGTGGAGVAKHSKNGKHELLRDESESSDVDEFTMPDKIHARKGRDRCGMCSTCWSVCWGFLLVSCLVAVAGLIYLHFQLKKDLDQLQDRLNRVELEGQVIPAQMNEVSTKQAEILRNLKNLDSGEMGLQSLIRNVSLLIVQVSTLNATTRTLRESVASSAQVQALPQQFAELSKNVAAVGSNTELLQEQVKGLQDYKTSVAQQLLDLDAKIGSLQLEHVTPEKTTKKPAEQAESESNTDDENIQTWEHLSTKQLAKRLSRLTNDVQLLNLTLTKDFDDLRTHSVEHEQSVTELYNYTTLLNTRLTFVELRASSSSDTDNDETLLRNQLQQFINTTVSEQIADFRNSSSSQQAGAMSVLKTYLQSSLVQFQLQADNISSNMAELNDSMQTFAEWMDEISSTVDSKMKNMEHSLGQMSDRLDVVEKSVDNLSFIHASNLSSSVTKHFLETNTDAPDMSASLNQTVSSTPSISVVKELPVFADLASDVSTKMPLSPPVRSVGKTHRKKRIPGGYK